MRRIVSYTGGVEHLLVMALIGAGIFLLAAPIVFGALAILLSVLGGVIVFAGSLLLSVRRGRWTWWEPEWAEHDIFADF